ncbi:MAG: histidine phosphatase family protein [Flavobacteriaceae bacterium]|nr:histidine phosphatase family protein [Flavobacteriaceae bacterium]
MKTWVMVRHAKSSWEFNLPDRERPLANRGVKDAILVGQELNKHNLHIDQVYSSPAKRAFDTALLMVSELGLSTENIQIEEELYDFMGEQALGFVRSLTDDLHTIMTFGHNDACTQLAQSLGNYVNTNIPTATAVIFHFNVSLWSDIQQCDCTSIRPKTLR